MKNSKKIVLMLLVILTLVFSVACSDDKEDKKPESNPVSEEVEDVTEDPNYLDSVKADDEEIAGYPLIKTLAVESPKGSSVLRYYGHGNIAFVQTAKNVLNYKAVNLKDINAAKEKFEPLKQKYVDLKGVKYSIEYGENQLVEELIMDYRKVEFEKMKDLPGQMTSSPNNGVNIDASVEMLKKKGYKEK